jgi:MFS family permease
MSRSHIAYQGSSVLSVLGNTLTAVVLPLLVLQTTGSVLSAGWIALATGLPQFLAAALGGVALDRLNRRAVAVAGDLASAASIAGLALVHATAGLNLTWFIVFGCLSAVGDVPAMTAREAMAPRLSKETGTPVERIVAVQSGLTSVAFIVGPVLAGAMIGWGVQNAALWVTATMSALAACAGLALPRSVGRVGREAVTRVRPLREFAAGVRHLVVDLPLVRLATLTTMVTACTVGIVQGLVIPFMMLEAGRPGSAGVILACFAGGIGLGAALFAAGHRTFKPRALAAVGGASAVAGIWLMAIAPGFGAITVAAAVIGAGTGLLSALLTTVSVTAPDPALQGRVLGNQNALLLGISPFAILAASFGIQLWGVTGVLVALAAVVTCTMALMVTARSWRLAPALDLVAAAE